jgi:cation:H+ antiporter
MQAVRIAEKGKTTAAGSQPVDLLLILGARGGQCAVSDGVWVMLFLAGTGVSLGSSWLLVSRLERLGERVGMSEALLGMVAALAADAPEITSAVTALAHGQAAVGAGVVVGSNVFNLAALLGLGAVVAGRIGLHRRVVWFSGTVALWVALVCVLTVLGACSAIVGLALVAAVLVPYLLVLGSKPQRLARLPLPAAWTRWLTAAVHEEELEIDEAVAARRGTWRDAVVAGVMLLVVVAASALMEDAGTTLGTRLKVADIITGGLVLAIVTSLPNAVAAVYLASRGRGAAVLSTALNSNALNIAVGLLLPAAITGLGPRTGQGVMVAGWYAGLTVVALAFAYRDKGLTRIPGAVIIGAYLVFVAALIVSTLQGSVDVATALLPAALVGAASILLLARSRRQTTVAGSASGAVPRPGLLPGWSEASAWRAGLIVCATVAVVDAATGHRLILMGLLAFGPCCALLGGRWRRTAATGVIALALGVLLGVPDRVFATFVQYAFLAAIAIVACSATACAAVIERRRAA